MITRREFAAGLSAAALGASPLLAKDSPPKVAITMDDFNWRIIPESAEPNKTILGTLAKRSLRAALFVIGQNADSPAGQKLARAWCDAGHIIGNHTYSHPAITTVSAEEFIDNIARAETILQDLPTYRKLFRFPALKEGETRAKRDAVRTWLAQHDYRIGHVTIDTSDWYYDQRLRAKLKEDPKFDVLRYHDVYLEHMWDCATKYDLLSRDVLGRSVPHTILVHYNLLNTLFLDNLLSMFESKGWQLIEAETAFQDPVFQSKPDIVPAGESIVWQLARASGKFESRLLYPGEGSEYEKAKLDKLGL